MMWGLNNIADFSINDYLVQNVLDIFYDAMGEGKWTAEEVIRQFQSSNHFGFYESEGGKKDAYVFATVPDECFESNYVLWIDACSVRKKIQGKGVFNAVITAIENISRKPIGYIGGRTQNPIIMKAYGKLSNLTYYPFDYYYPNDIVDYLERNIKNEVGDPSKKEEFAFNRQNGILKAIYKGKLGDYTIDLSDEVIKVYEGKLEQWGFDRYNGDGIIILKKML